MLKGIIRSVNVYKLYEESMFIAWHQDRWWDRCVVKRKKEIDKFLK